MRIILYIILFIIILLGITFAYLNADAVAFNYYFGEKSIPLSLLLVCSLGIGLLLGFLVMGISWIKLKTINLRLNKRLKCATQEVENLRSIPIKDSH
jgi:putative membrane protein